jgi:hypothetical protein
MTALSIPANWVPANWEEMGSHLGQLLAGLNPQPEVPSRKFGPTPDPWVSIIITQLVQAAVVKDLAGRIEGGSRSQLGKSAEAVITKIIDEDLCPPQPPYPGPHPKFWEVVTGLSLVANQLQSGGVRDAIGDITKMAVEKAGLAR